MKATQFYTLAEAGALIGRSPSTLRHQAARGRLTARRIGKTWVVTSVDLAAYVRDRMRPEREEPR